MFARTSRFKITSWFICFLGGVQLFYSILLYLSFSRQMHRTIDGVIKEEAEALTQYISTHSANDLRVYIDLMAREGEFSPKYIQISNDSGILVKSANLTTYSLPLSHQEEEIYPGYFVFQTVSLRSFPVHLPLRMVITTTRSRNAEAYLIIQVATSTRHARRTEEILDISLLCTGGLVLLVSGFGSFLLAGKVLEPIRAITQEIERIEAGNLSQRIKVSSSQDETARLIAVLNRMLTRLETSFRQISEFTVHASHELKIPLTVMKSGMEVAFSRARTTEEYREVVSNNMEELKRLIKIVDNLFTLTRIDSGKIKLEPQVIRLDLLLEDVREEIGLLAEIQEIAIDLIQLDEVLVNGDKIWLKQLFLNLMDNAFKYTPAGGKVSLSLKRMGNQAIFTISDTGIGIPEEDLPFIFSQFYRVIDGRADSKPGSGLGLSISQWIVEAHRGHIEVESQLDHGGTTFIVTLPLDDPSLPG